MGPKSEVQQQSQAEPVQYPLVPTDATAASTALAALAAAQAAAASGPIDAAEFWRRSAGQLAGSGVDLSALAASAAGQAHAVQVRLGFHHASDV